MHQKIDEKYIIPIHRRKNYTITIMIIIIIIHAVNKMHDSKITHEKISEYNLALILCHKINALFTVQQTFVDAEKLAQTMYSEEFANCIIDVSIYILK